jgi:hypothetical protein
MPHPRQVTNAFDSLMNIGDFRASKPDVPSSESSSEVNRVTGGHNYFYEDLVYTYTPTVSMKVDGKTAENLKEEFAKLASEPHIIDHRGHLYSCTLKVSNMSFTDNSVTITASGVCLHTLEDGQRSGGGFDVHAANEHALMFTLMKFMKAFDD